MPSQLVIYRILGSLPFLCQDVARSGRTTAQTNGTLLNTRAIAGYPPHTGLPFFTYILAESRPPLFLGNSRGAPEQPLPESGGSYRLTAGGQRIGPLPMGNHCFTPCKVFASQQRETSISHVSNSTRGASSRRFGLTRGGTAQGMVAFVAVKRKRIPRWILSGRWRRGR